MSVIITLSALFISSIFYRCGGASKSGQWYDFLLNTKTRDAGCSLISTLLIGYLIAWHWTLILVFGLTWASLTTYYKRGPTARWWNWLLVGAGISLATLPFIIAEGHWVGFASRTIILSGGVMIVSELEGNAVREELLRGFLICATIPLLLI